MVRINLKQSQPIILVLGGGKMEDSGRKSISAKGTLT